MAVRGETAQLTITVYLQHSREYLAYSEPVGMFSAVMGIARDYDVMTL